MDNTTTSHTPEKKTPSSAAGRIVPVELVISDEAEVFVFHSKPFEGTLSWLEFDLDTFNLDFVLKDGDVRRFGARVPDHLTKHMQNAFQVMMVQMDEETGQPISGDYFPLVLHRGDHKTP